MYVSVSRETLVCFTDRFLLAREGLIFRVKQAIR